MTISEITAGEQPVSFSSEGGTIRGVLHRRRGGGPALDMGVVFLHGWSGCRLGPHRMFVKAARELSARGCVCLRFDFRGRGDSDGSFEQGTIQSMIQDARRAVAFICTEGAVNRVALLGICSGCKVAVGTAAAPNGPEVDGLVLWSAEPMGRLRDSGVGMRKSLSALRDYVAKATRPATWRKLLGGRVNVGLVGKAVLRHEAPSGDELRQENEVLNRFRKYPGKALFISGTNDPDGAPAAGRYAALCARHGIGADFESIDGANHSYYSLAWERRVLDLTCGWLERLAPPAGAGRPGGH